MQKSKTWKILAMITVALVLVVALAGCNSTSNSKIRKQVDNQQEHYDMVQPIPSFDYSIPRDILTQIYKVVTTEARNTYTLIQSMTGEVIFYGPSLGYGIPVDTQLTNPLCTYGDFTDSAVIEQAEPNGLFSSKNTDGTWVLFVDDNGDVTPVYTEQKVTTFPYAVIQSADGVWVRADNKPASFTIDVSE